VFVHHGVGVPSAPKKENGHEENGGNKK